MVEQGLDVMFILLINEESSFLQYKLKLFSEEFQTFFKEVLPDWKGDIDLFKPTETIIRRVFESDTSIL
jgi:hypothetical protein